MTRLTVDLRRPEHRYLADHVVLGWTALPGAFVLAAALDAAGDRAVTDLTMPGLVPLDEDAPLVVEVTEDDAGAWRFGDLAACTLAAAGEAPAALVPGPCPEPVDGAAFYAALAELGATYGPAFQGVQDVRLGDGEAVGQIATPPDLTPQASHPAVLDACAQVALAALGLRTAALPVSVARAHRHAPLPRSMRSHATLRGDGDGPGETIVDVHVTAPYGEPLLDLEGIVLRGRRRR